MGIIRYLFFRFQKGIYSPMQICQSSASASVFLGCHLNLNSGLFYLLFRPTHFHQANLEHFDQSLCDISFILIKQVCISARWIKLASFTHSTSTFSILSLFAAGAETIITSDQAVRGGKLIELKATVDAAVALCPDVKRVFVTHRTGNKVSQTDKDIPLEEVSCYTEWWFR